MSAGQYRYSLRREVAPLTGSGCVCWVMCNPSTADETTDDPTIRRVKRFTEDHGYARLVVVNLFAARATNPAELASMDAPVGPDNWWYIQQAVRESDAVVYAWGAAIEKASRPGSHLWHGGALIPNPLCLGVTATGHPRHPLYVSAAQRFVPFAGLPVVGSQP